MRIRWPWRNLGCFALRFDSGLYIDVSRRPFWGIFVNNGNVRVRINLESGRIGIEGVVSARAVNVDEGVAFVNAHVNAIPEMKGGERA